MKKGLRIAFFSISVLALLFSCAHQPALNPAGREFQDMSVEQLQALSTEDPESCLETISALREVGTEDSVLLSSWNDIEEKALGSLIERYGKEEAEGRLAEAERSLASLEAARHALAESETLKKYLSGGEEVLEKARLRLLKGRSEEFYAKGFYAPGASYLNRVLGLLETSEGAQAIADEAYLKLWLERSAVRGDEFTTRRLASLLRRADATGPSLGGSALPDQASPPPDNPKASLAQLAEGVVTVHVDKGLKLQRGLAYPDRILGSAFQVDGQGYYLSNYHVVASEVDPKYEGYSSLSIRPFDKSEARIPGKVVGWNQAMDVALIKSEPSARTLYLHSLEDPEKGSRVYSIGSPAGLENSVSSGIVSAPGRRILARGDALQIDVPVNPGSSGGPLVDEEGRVVGLIFAGLSGFQGLNFALPASWISQLLPSLFAGGETKLSWIGLGLARTLDERLEISYVSPWRRAARPGDSLVAIDGEATGSLSQAQYLLTGKPLHSLCAISVSREGRTRTLLAKTRAMPENPLIEQAKNGTLEALLQGAAGMVLAHVSGSRGPGGSYKILKLWPGMPADESGLREGDLIKFIRFRENYEEGVASFDISVKSPASGYLQKTMRLVLSLEMNNFI